jgi:hypothetical protein
MNTQYRPINKMKISSLIPKPQIFRILVVLSMASLPAAAQIQKQRDIIDLGSRLELFVDTFLIDKMENAGLRLHIPRDEGPVIFFDNPWEGIFSGYTTIIRDGDIYRMYYRGIPAVGKDGSDSEVTCYAESTDGIKWIKPRLGLFEINGSRENNVILAHAAPATHNFSPFLDNNSQRSDNYRFKAFGGLEKGLIAYGSADGIHWEKIHDDPVLKGGEFDSQNVVFWSISEKKYICYFRKWARIGERSIRSVGRSTSEDFINWTQPVLMDFGNTEPEELYTNQTSPYFRAPHLYVSVAARFFPGKQVITDEQAQRLKVNPSYYHDCSDAVLLTSRGGNSYQRTFMEGFLRPGIGLDNWVSRTNYPALNVVATGETEMSFYVNQDYAQPTTHLQRYSLRIDGFTSLHAGYDAGEILTRPFKFTGSKLIINFSTSAAGYILFEILDEKGKISGSYSSDNCIPVIGNELDRKVEWKQETKNLSELQGKTVRLRILMKDADLYSIKFE